MRLTTPQKCSAVDVREGNREAIKYLESLIRGHECEIGPEKCPVEHFWADGAYGRQITMPAGTLVVGKVHRHAHVNVISQGECYVFTEGRGLEHLKAPCTFVNEPYTRRVVWNIEDTVWTTVHVTDATTEADVEHEVIAPAGELECRGLQLELPL